MENQHFHIKGERDLAKAEIDLLNEARQLAMDVGAFIDRLQRMNGPLPQPDQRWVAIARTELQKGFLSLARAIARPNGF